jgi:hypothetical protein
MPAASGAAPWGDRAAYEVQVIELPDRDALDGYQADPRRTTLAGIRDQAIAPTEIIPVTTVTGD